MTEPREDTIRRVLTLLADRGIRMSADVYVGMVDIDVDSAMEIISGGLEAYTARDNGVTVEQMRSFIEARGFVSCSAMTKGGKPCRNDDCFQCVDPSTWLRRQGWLCASHFGAAA